MKAFLSFAIIYLIASGAGLAAAPAINSPAPRRATTQTTRPGITVYLTPDSDPEAVIVRDLNAAKHSIVLQTGTLQSLPVVKSLLAARQRGIDVQVFLPEYDDQAYYYDRPHQAGRNLIPPSLNVRVLNSFVGLRGVTCVIDGATVLVGSFELRPNDGASVTTNLIRVENSPGVARTYAAEAERLRASSDLARGYQKYVQLSPDAQQQVMQRYFARLTTLLAEGNRFHLPDLAPSPPPLDVFPKLPWPAGVDPSKLNPRGVGVIWVVDEQGAAKDIRLSQSSGNPQIDALALDQVRRYHYPVSYEVGKPAPFGHARVFRLDELFTLPAHT